MVVRSPRSAPRLRPSAVTAAEASDGLAREALPAQRERCPDDRLGGAADEQPDEAARVGLIGGEHRDRLGLDRRGRRRCACAENDGRADTRVRPICSWCAASQPGRKGRSGTQASSILVGHPLSATPVATGSNCTCAAAGPGTRCRCARAHDRCRTGGAPMPCGPSANAAPTTATASRPRSGAAPSEARGRGSSAAAVVVGILHSLPSD